MLEKEQSQRKAVDTKIKKKEKRKFLYLKIFSRSNFNKYRSSNKIRQQTDILTK